MGDVSKDIAEALSVERVEAAYEATGLTPVRGETFKWGIDGMCGACAVGAVLAADGKVPRTLAPARRPFSGFAAACLDVNSADLATFMRGFDAKGAKPFPMGHPAYEHGVAVARAVFGGDA